MEPISYEEFVKILMERAKENEEIWNLKESCKRLENENESLKTQLDIANTDNERYIQIIRILSEAFKRYTHLPSATAALEWSKEAETVPYKDMKILEMVLEDIEKGVKGYED